MRVKFTIAVCALLMLGTGGRPRSMRKGSTYPKARGTVVEHGRNQMMGAIRLDSARNRRQYR